MDPTPLDPHGALEDGGSRHLVVRCRSSSLSAARDLVGRCCRVAGLRDDAEQVAVLLTSEVVTNAVRHAGTDAQLFVCLAEQRVHVEVTDGSRERPCVQPWSTDGTSGRGMALVDSLASRWGVRPCPTGKVVWFDVVDPEPNPISGRGAAAPR